MIYQASNVKIQPDSTAIYIYKLGMDVLNEATIIDGFIILIILDWRKYWSYYYRKYNVFRRNFGIRIA